MEPSENSRLNDEGQQRDQNGGHGAPETAADTRQAGEQSGDDRQQRPQLANEPGRQASTGVAWLRYKRLARFLTQLQKRCACVVEVTEKGTKAACRIEADESGAKTLDRLLGRIRFRRFWLGMAVGTAFGLFAAYILIPSGVTYVYSSRKGLLPPEYDALMRTKNINEQAVQILEHEFEPKTKGLFRKRTYFEVDINDTVTLVLTYDKSRKGLVMALGQRVGSRVAGDVVKGQVAGTGVDSVLNVSEGLGDAVERTASMKIEKDFRSNPVLKVIVDGEGDETEYVNYFAPEIGYKKDFCTADSDTANVEAFDHTEVRRDRRIPTPEDEEQYETLVREFVLKYRKGEITGDRRR